MLQLAQHLIVAATVTATLVTSQSTSTDMFSRTKAVVSCPDKRDCTKALQTALSDLSLDEVIVPPAENGEPWAVGPLFIHRSNLKFTLQPGAQLYAKAGDFKRTGDCLLQIKSDMGHGHVQNVSIVATGATLRMRKMEYLPPEYVKAEWRHTLSINGASDVAVVGGTYLESGGDGIYVDGGGLANHSRNVVLDGVTTDGAWRNGLSVISAINLTVIDSVFKNTNGTNPQCGIDLEPDFPTDKLQQIKLKRVKLLNNTRCGFTMGPYAFVTAGAANPVSVLVDGMQVYDTPGSNYSWGSVASERRNGKAVGLSDVYNLSGSVMLRNVDIRRCYGPALGFENWPNGQVSTMIENLTVTDSARQSHSWPGVPVPPVHMDPIGGMGKDENSSLHVGGVVFSDCTINDDRPRDWFSCVWDGTHNHSTPPRLVNISGDVAVHNPALGKFCHADFGNPSLGVSPDITIEVACNPT